MFSGAARQLTIYLGESDSYQRKALYIAILEMLRREGFGGATVTRGIAGFGASSLIHTAAVLRLSMDMPIVITVVDRPARIERVIDPLVAMAPHSLITVHDIEVVHAGVAMREGLPDLKVADVMRHEVITVAPGDPIRRVVEVLLDRDFTALPVVDANRKVVGVISDTDLLERGGISVALNLRRVAASEAAGVLREGLDDSSRTVREVMTTEVVSVSPQASLGAAAKLMVARKLKRLPVIDADGRLTGMIGRLDLLNTIAAVQLPQWHPEAYKPGVGGTVGDVMATDVASVAPDAALAQLLETLVGSRHRCVIVVDGARHVAGIIADSDLVSRVSPESRAGVLEALAARLRRGAAGAEARHNLARQRGRSAAELMTREVVTVPMEMPVATALALSAERHIKRLPVVDLGGALVGIVGRAELLRALLA